MRAIGYARVSTDEQASSGLGLDSQRAAIAEAAERLGLELGPIHSDEGVSGSLEPRSRPGLAQVLAQLKKGDVLLIAKRDRLARNYVHVAALERELLEERISIRSAAGEGTDIEGPPGWLLRAMIDVFAEFERLCVIDRTRRALRAKRDRGQRAGSVPFGFRLGSGDELVRDNDEQVALLLMQEHRAAGESFAAIARTLELRGYKPRGKQWWPGSVRSILRTDASRKAPNGPL